MKRLVLILVALGGLDACAHEMLYKIEPDRKPMAVKAYFADGEALSYGEYEVYAPSDPRIPYQKGRTDRAGYLSFVPFENGSWRVRVIEKSGHGFDIKVEVGAAAPERAGGPGPSASWYLRPLIGVVVIGIIFAGLYLVSKKKGGAI